MKTFALLLLLVSAAVSQALVVSYDAQIPLSNTGFNKTLALTQFDPALGTLESVKVTISGQLLAAVKLENLGPAVPADSDVYISNNINLSVQHGTATLLSVASNVANTAVSAYGLAAFDGQIDFAGASGKTVVLDNPAASQAYVFTSSLSDFIGTGSYILNAAASATGSASGLNNMIVARSSQAAVSATIEYTYVPEPLSVSLLGIGSVLLLRKRNA